MLRPFGQTVSVQNFRIVAACDYNSPTPLIIVKSKGV